MRTIGHLARIRTGSQTRLANCLSNFWAAVGNGFSLFFNGFWANSTVQEQMARRWGDRATPGATSRLTLTQLELWDCSADLTDWWAMLPASSSSSALATNNNLVHNLCAARGRSAIRRNHKKKPIETGLIAHYEQIAVGQGEGQLAVSWGGPLLLPPSCISRACDRSNDRRQLHLNSPA